MGLIYMYISGFCLIVYGFISLFIGDELAIFDSVFYYIGIGFILLIIANYMDQRETKKRQAVFKQFGKQFNKKKLSKKKNLTTKERSSLEMSSMLGDSEARNILAKNKKAQQKKKKASRKTSLKQPIQKGLTTLEQMYQDALKAKLSKDLISTLDSNYKYRVESINEYKNGNTDTQVAKEMIQYAIDEFKVEVRSIVLQPKIIAFLKKEKTKLPASDIDFQLKIGNVNLVKKLCEELYRDKKIGRTGNYRYFV